MELCSGSHGPGGGQVRGDGDKKPGVTFSEVGQVAVKRRIQGKNLISVSPWLHFIPEIPLSQGNLLSLNVKTLSKHGQRTEILDFKDWNLSELVDLSRDGGGQGGHCRGDQDNGRSAGNQVCNHYTFCTIAN